MRLANGLFIATLLLLTAYLKVEVVTDSEIEKQIDLSTQHGPWLCEGKVGEGDSVTDLASSTLLNDLCPSLKPKNRSCVPCINA